MLEGLIIRKLVEEQPHDPPTRGPGCPLIGDQRWVHYRDWNVDPLRA